LSEQRTLTLDQEEQSLRGLKNLREARLRELEDAMLLKVQQIRDESGSNRETARELSELNGEYEALLEAPGDEAS